MSRLLPDDNVYALPFEQYELKGSIAIKRGRLEFSISSEDALDNLRPVLERLQQQVPAKVSELCAIACDNETTLQLLNELHRRRILIVGDLDLPPVESPTDVFNWEICAEERSVKSESGYIVFVGLNSIAFLAARSFWPQRDADVIIVDDPALRSSNYKNFQVESELPSPISIEELQRIDRPISYLLAASEIGRLDAMLFWNRFCLSRAIKFLPIILRDWMGQVGPFVYPGETACLMCLNLRQKASTDAWDKQSYHAHRSENAVAGYHPSMAQVLGHVAALELFKAKMLLQGTRFAQVVDVNLMSSRMTPRRVLKVPRCTECGSPGQKTSPALIGTNNALLS